MTDDRPLMDHIAALGFAVRPLPLPSYLTGHCLALVPYEHGEERLDLTGTPIPVLDVAAAGDRRSALWRLLERATALRLPRSATHDTAADVAAADDSGRSPAARDAAYDAATDDAAGAAAEAVGAGPTVQEATAAAIYEVLARLQARVGVGKAARITDWAATTRHVLRSPADIAGTLECYLLEEETAGVPCVGAVLRMARPPHVLCALACDLRLSGAVERAVAGVLRKYAVTLLAREPTVAWLRAAFEGGEPELTVSGETRLTPPAREPAAGDPDGLADVLARHDLKATVQPLHRADGMVVVRCRITSTRPREREAAGGESLWDPPQVPTLGLAAPRQLSLGYDTARVKASRTLHENSKLRLGYGSLPKVDLADMGPSIQRLLGQATRDFPHARLSYHLPKPREPEPLPLTEAVRRRRSWAPMGSGPIELARLARVLRLSCDVTGSARTSAGVTLPLRATPSAGGLYSTDLFVLANRVESVTPGLYYLHPHRSALQLVTTDYTPEEVVAHTGYRDRVGTAAAMVIYVGCFRRNQWKYWERGYRTVLLDCGHLAQSVVTNATAVRLVAHPMVAFIDDYFNRLVGVDGVDEAVLHLTLLSPAEDIR